MANQFDIEDEEYARQLAYADALRKQSLQSGGEMRGRIYVRKNPWENFVQGFAGSALGNVAAGRRREIEGQRQQQLEQWMQQLPGATRQQEMTGPMPSGEAMSPIEAPKDPRQYADEMRRHAMAGMNIKHPLAQALAQRGLVAAMESPERQAELADRAAARQAEIDARTQAARELQAQRAAEQAQRDRERAEDKKDLMKFGASLRQPREPRMQIVNTVDENGNPVQRVVELTLGATFPALPKATGKSKVDPAAAAERAQAGIDLIDRMIGTRDEKGELVGGSKEHPGFGGYVGMTLFPGQRFLEGSDVASYEALQKQLGGQAMLEAYQQLRGSGAISNKEGEQATIAISGLTKGMSEKEYIKSAGILRNILKRGVERLQSGKPAVSEGSVPTGGGRRKYNPATGEFE